MDCGRVNEKLTDFLEDLLTDAEYQAFLDHLDQCPKCFARVTSIDAFSNWIWKLGDIKVPDDLMPTVLFRMKQLENVRKSPGFGERKWVAWVLIAVLACAAFYVFGHFAGRNHQTDREEGGTSGALSPGRDERAKELLEQLTTMANNLGTADRSSSGR